MLPEVVKKVVDSASYRVSEVKLFTVGDLRAILHESIELLVDALDEVLGSSFQQ